MLHSRHILVADLPDGSTKTLYQGENVAEAERLMEKACQEAEAETVIIFHHPPIGRVRYPVQEKIDAENRVKETERLKNLGAQQKIEKAAAMRRQADLLKAQAKKLEAEAEKHSPAKPEKPNPEK